MRLSRRWVLIPVGFLLTALAVAVLPRASAPSGHARLEAATLTPRQTLHARRLRARTGAAPTGTQVVDSDLFGERVFADAEDGFALANHDMAQYPAVTTDGGRTWTIAGPQFHIDAADGPEAVGSVGMSTRRIFFAYGSSVVDVTTDGGRTWWETFLGDLVMAVVPGLQPHSLVAYVQSSVGRSAVTWQYVSRDGRTWRYSSALGG